MTYGIPELVDDWVLSDAPWTIQLAYIGLVLSARHRPQG
jgi:hypothetical protein